MISVSKRIHEDRNPPRSEATNEIGWSVSKGSQLVEFRMRVVSWMAESKGLTIDTPEKEHGYPK